MIKFLLKLIAVVVVGLLCYNFFFGTEEEKERSRAVFGQVKELGSSVGSLLKSEKAKFDEGKYDDAMAKVKNTFNNLKNQDQESGGGMSKEIDQLEAKKNTLESQLSTAKENNVDNLSAKEVGVLYNQLESLYKEMQNVSTKMEQADQSAE
tara:strand:+ start:604 stop:1056 length:453 start_codon:yes stop_codon:yes gene_type:complete